jgi:osmotically-inducible protein OsmY
MNKLLRAVSICVLGLFLFGVAGCVSTTNRESTGEYIDSAATTTKVKAALVNNLGIASVSNIEVTTYKGVVQLSGFVNNQNAIARAISAAKTVPGVVAVENSLLVKGQLR